VTSKGTPFAALCPDACADKDAAWAMPCAWMAIKSLPEACAGAFVPSLEGAASENAAAAGDEPNPLTLGGKAQLHACDEHAVCFACYSSHNAGSTADARYRSRVGLLSSHRRGLRPRRASGSHFHFLDARRGAGFISPSARVEGPLSSRPALGGIGRRDVTLRRLRYCEAVASYYGGFGVPFVTDTGSWSLRKPDGASIPGLATRGDRGVSEAAGEVGANAAWRAINDDWAFWCDAGTLAAIEDGTFDARYAPTRR
jgi:hypothetical protein